MSANQMETTRQDVEVLLENFDDYVDPAGDENPWFTLDEINQQFAWDDIPDAMLVEWLTELALAGKVQVEILPDEDRRKYRWLS